LFVGTEGLAFVVRLPQKTHNETLLLVDVNS
jgi:hypothetical protein